MEMVVLRVRVQNAALMGLYVLSLSWVDMCTLAYLTLSCSVFLLEDPLREMLLTLTKTFSVFL